MPDSHIPTQYQLSRVVIWYLPDGSVEKLDITIQTFNSFDKHINHEHLTNITLPVGVLTTIKNVVNSRLLQLETDTGWTRKP